jgi:hypothetical protein
MKTEIIKIAKEVRKELIEIYGSPKAVCLQASKMLENKLINNGFNAIIIRGRFLVDEPDMENYDIDEEQEIFDPIHYWIEIDKEILDITADQFRGEVLDELEEITYGSYEENTRYIIDVED